MGALYATAGRGCKGILRENEECRLHYLAGKMPQDGCRPAVASLQLGEMTDIHQESEFDLPRRCGL